MSNFLHKALIKSAQQKSRNKFDLSCNLIASHDFYQNFPVYVHEMIPNESIKVNVSSLTRTSPLQQPMYADVRMRYRAFFVPMRTIMYGFTDFYEQTVNTSINGIIQNVTRFKWGDLYDCLNSNQYNWTREVSESADYDYTYIDVSGTTTQHQHYRKFSYEGKLIFKILCALGYKLNIGMVDDNNATDKNTYVSAMPLLAFAKIWFDWFANPQYKESFTGEQYFHLISTTPTLTASNINDLFKNVIIVCYGADYFTSAWDNPTAPNDTLTSSVRVHDDTVINPLNAGSSTPSYQNEVTTYLDAYGSDRYGTQNGTPVLQNAAPSQGTGTMNGSPARISQYILNVLHSVTDFVKRQQMAGCRALDRYMADFGVQLKSEKLNRSVYLGKYDSSFNIGDVMQTTPDISDGTSTTHGVGSYTGKMINSSNGNFEYSTDEFGFFIITCYIEPMPMYVDGRPRHLYHLNKFDFFNGDFDNLGVQAIRVDELCSGCFSDAFVPSDYKADGIFAFAPRYAEYKVAKDNLIGDFLLTLYNGSLDGWTLARRYDCYRASENELDLKHSRNFCVSDASQFFDIFQDRKSLFDHFFTIFNFDVKIFAPMKTYYDMYDYSNEDGKDIAMSVNGTQITD